MAALNAHILRPNLVEGDRSAKRLLQLTSSMPEKTWKAIALSSCAKLAALKRWNEPARENLSRAIQIIENAELPLAAWRVEAAAAEIFSTCGTQQEAARFGHPSRHSRERLFNSLATKDPLFSSS
jgi:hypothetical protein